MALSGTWGNLSLMDFVCCTFLVVRVRKKASKERLTRKKAPHLLYQLCHLYSIFSSSQRLSWSEICSGFPLAADNQ